MALSSQRHSRNVGILAGLVATAPLAFAQVSVFGVLDAGLHHGSADGAGSVSRVEGDGNTSSRLGFRGTEEFAPGWKASFWIETAINPDTGTSGATSTNNKDSVNTGGLTWGRRSTIGVQGPHGELRIGRDYVPSFGNLTTSMHPFGTNGVGSSGHFFYPVNAGGTTVRTHVRASNAIGYHLPDNAWGVYGAAMVASGEQPGGAATSDDGDYRGWRVGWRASGVNLSASNGSTRYATGDYTQRNAGVNYKWGPARWMFLWGTNKVGATRTTARMLGTQWSVGTNGEVRAAYSTLSAKGVAGNATHLALGYVHDLSRRTALYANWARIDNKGNGTRFNVGLATSTPGGASRGVDLGLRHSF